MKTDIRGASVLLPATRAAAGMRRVCTGPCPALPYLAAHGFATHQTRRQLSYGWKDLRTKDATSRECGLDQTMICTFDGMDSDAMDSDEMPLQLCAHA